MQARSLRSLFAIAMPAMLILAATACSWSLPGMAGGRPKAIPAMAAGPEAAVDAETMRQVYLAARTPYKYGIVMKVGKENPGKNDWVDCPSVFKCEGKWYLTYIVYDGTGYESCIAESDDLLHWKPMGKTLSFTKTGWDRVQKAGYIALQDTEFGGSYELEKFKGKYWMSYIGGALEGMETDPLSTGMAWTTTPNKAVEWTRLPEPVLSAAQPDARAFEKLTLFKSNVIRDPEERLGYPFVMYYNAKPPRQRESIGMAVSKDMVNWRRYGETAVIDAGIRVSICGDPQVVRMGDVWTMFYFGAFWRPGAFDTFACSRDLLHWTKWTGPDLITSSTRWDRTFAHKPWIVVDKGVVYHFYCAVGDEGRVIAVATSKPMRE